MTESDTLSMPDVKQPLFFEQPVPVDATRHKSAGLHRSSGFHFAKQANSVPITVYEFAEAVRSFPVVFSEEDVPAPVAIVGLGQQNYFITEDGSWRKGHYIPAYIRKYPFGLMHVEAQGQYVLCVDEASAHFMVESPDLPFFDAEGKQTEIAEMALNLCGSFQKQHEMTRQFGKALADEQLLKSKQVEVTDVNGEKTMMSGFQLIDEEAWRNKPASLLKSWNEKGWLGLVYLSMASQHNWQYLPVIASS